MSQARKFRVGRLLRGLCLSLAAALRRRPRRLA